VPGFSFIEPDLTCLVCNVTGCVFCEQANVCLTCSAGSTLEADLNLCVFACSDTNC
jgi:hypothetical protein